MYDEKGEKLGKHLRELIKNGLFRQKSRMDSTKVIEKLEERQTVVEKCDSGKKKPVENRQRNMNARVLSYQSKNLQMEKGATFIGSLEQP